MRDQDSAYTVYQKAENRDDFINFLSTQNDRTKSGIVIRFFLRALRICSQEHLEEIQYITQAFMKLRYPKGMYSKTQGHGWTYYRKEQQQQ